MGCDFEVHRKMMAWCEIAGLLHDVGKLSSKWLEYRQLWQEKGNAGSWDWGNDPHCHKFIDTDNGLIESKYSSFKMMLKNGLVELNAIGLSCCGDKYDLTSIDDVVNKHESIQIGAETFLSQLKIADSIDSAWDRNNPLFCREQKKGHPFDTEVFGHESDLPTASTISFKNGIPDFAKYYLHGAPPKPHIVTGAELDEKRKELYTYLNEHLAGYLENPTSYVRLNILGAIRHALDYGMADTSRPGNDTTLWEHAYSTSALFKAAVVRSIATGKFCKGFTEFRFRLLGIGWNGLAYLANSPRLGDALGRQDKIVKLIDKIRHVFEWKLKCGSLVYWDVNQVVFLVPDIDMISVKNARRLLKPVFRKITDSDIFPAFHVEENCFSLTSIVKVTDALKEQRHVPVCVIDKEDFKKMTINGGTKELCPVCRRRFVVNVEYGRCNACFLQMAKVAEASFGKNTTAFLSEIIRGNKKQGNNRVALVVAHFGLRNWLGGRMHRSLLVTEANGITEEIGNLGIINSVNDDNIKELRDVLKLTGEYNYDKILGEVKLYSRFLKNIDEGNDNWYKEISNADSDKNKISATKFVYGRRTGESPERFLKTCRTLIDNLKNEYPELKSAPEEEILAAALCTKTPTPSTLLDTWHASYRFIQDLSVATDVGKDGKWLDCIGKQERQVLECSFVTIAGINAGCAYLCDDNAGNRFDVVFISNQQNNGNKRIGYVIGGRYKENIKGQKDRTFEVFEVEGTKKRSVCKNVVISQNTDHQTMAYYPVREVLLSPDLAMFLVPADKAFAVAAEIKRRYDDEFSKVRGRLPFNIGLLYFQYKHPIYLALDAARRMVEGFESRERAVETGAVEKLADKCGKMCFIIKPENCSRKIPFDMEHTLGDGSNDYHHPYIYVKPGNGVETRESYFRTVGFDKDQNNAASNELHGIVNVNELQNGDSISFTPSGFDFELLDTIESRHSVAYDKNNHRRSIPFQFKNKPYYLEEIEVFQEWWKRFKDDKFFGREITDTELRGLECLWLQKMDEWEVDLGKTGTSQFKSWKEIVETSLKATFPAFREMESKDNKEKYMLEHFQETVDAVTSGLLLDVLQLFFHIQKEKVADDK